MAPLAAEDRRRLVRTARGWNEQSSTEKGARARSHGCGRKDVTAASSPQDPARRVWWSLEVVGAVLVWHRI